MFKNSDHKTSALAPLTQSSHAQLQSELNALAERGIVKIDPVIPQRIFLYPQYVTKKDVTCLKNIFTVFFQPIALP